jgi:4-diphosphocytidyl-2C-methyl-D-erythritol kinase
MSGSGPTVFALFQDPQQASLAFKGIKQQQRWDVFLVKLLLP